MNSATTRSFARANVLAWRAIQLRAKGDAVHAQIVDALSRAELAMVRYHADLADRGLETNGSPAEVLTDEILGLMPSAAPVVDELAGWQDAPGIDPDATAAVALTALGEELARVAHALEENRDEVARLEVRKGELEAQARRVREHQEHGRG